MASDREKARELADKYEKSDWRRDDIVAVALAAMQYAYKEAAQMSSSRITALALGRDREVMVQFSEALESRARDLGAE